MSLNFPFQNRGQDFENIFVRCMFAFVCYLYTPACEFTRYHQNRHATKKREEEDEDKQQTENMSRTS